MVTKKPFKIESWIRLIRNFLGQNFFYMDITERLFKIIIEISFFVIFFISYLLIFKDIIWGVFVSVSSAHLFNWLFNGSVYKILLDEHFVHPPANAIERKINYIERIYHKAQSLTFINIIAIYGSVSRGTVTERSDLDFRLVRHPGFINGLKSCFFIFKERTYCLFKRIPLCGGYIGDDLRFLSKMSKTEIPVILKNENESCKFIKHADPILYIKEINRLNHLTD